MQDSCFFTRKFLNSANFQFLFPLLAISSVPSYRSAVLYCITVRIGNKDHKNNDPEINEGNNTFLMLDDSNQNVQCSQVRVAVPFLQTETEQHRARNLNF